MGHWFGVARQDDVAIARPLIALANNEQMVTVVTPADLLHFPIDQITTAGEPNPVSRLESSHGSPPSLAMAALRPG